jgi:hypothetical protein
VSRQSHCSALRQSSSRIDVLRLRDGEAVWFFHKLTEQYRDVSWTSPPKPGQLQCSSALLLHGRAKAARCRSLRIAVDVSLQRDTPFLLRYATGRVRGQWNDDAMRRPAAYLEPAGNAHYQFQYTLPLTLPVVSTLY